MSVRISRGASLVLYASPSTVRVARGATLVLHSLPFFASDVTCDYEIQTSGDIVVDVTFDYGLSNLLEADVTFNYALRPSVDSDIFFDYRILDSFEVDASFDYQLDETVPSYVTQMPVLVLTDDAGPAKVTQFAILAMGLPIQDTRVTQIAVLPTTLNNPVPKPGTFAPMAPVRERWVWSTVVNRALSSREQRMALRENPRYQLVYDIPIKDERQRVLIYDFLYENMGKVFPYPAYQAFARIIPSPQSSGDRLYFNPAETDLREGEELAVFNYMTLETKRFPIVELHNDGATIDGNIDWELGETDVICPVLQLRLLEGSQIIMTEATIGTGRLLFESVQPREFLRINENLLYLLDGIPVLTPRPYGEADETLEQGWEWLDHNGTSLPSPRTYWPVNQTLVSGERSYRFDRAADMDYWRSFFDYCRGRLRHFRIPTFFDDLPLIEEVPLNATTFTTDNWRAQEYILQNAHRGVAIWRSTGVIYRRVVDAWWNRNEVGDPISMTFEVEAGIGNNAGDNIIRGISFLNLVRLDTDTIEVQHHTGYSTVTFAYKGIAE